MNEFCVGDRVMCVDATPLPVHVPGAVASEFSFPGGFIEEGVVYCVVEVGRGPVTGMSLRLLGHPVIRGQTKIWWDGLRFRRLAKASKILEESRSERISVGLAAVSS